MQEGTIKKISDQNLCRYFQAHVSRGQAWFFVAIVRSYEHMMFDRTLDPSTSTFEFFVPNDMVAKFLRVMKELEKRGVISDLLESENRLHNPQDSL